MGDQLTPEQYATLAAELAELEGPKRAEIVEAIATARAHGDLSENFEYHAAKNEQGLLERRITILRARLEGAEIVEKTGSGVVAVGSHVTVEDEDGGRLEVEISHLGGTGAVSPSSPLGSALVGRRVGETVEVAAPRGRWRAAIVAVR
jgi:transcription elongation factor GreA